MKSSIDFDIAIIGLGYVGIPLAMKFVMSGKTVVGIDLDSNKCKSINKGISGLSHIENYKISEMLERGFYASCDFENISRSKAIIFCVPTPLDNNRNPDLSFILSAMNCSLPFLRSQQLISLESTTFPGTTSEVLLPIIESAGFKVGKNIFLIYSPEREDPGNKEFHLSNTPKLVGGITKDCLKKGIELYENIVEQVISVGSTEIAEMSKLFENIFRMVNIGLVNEMKIVCDSMDIDINEVIDAAATKPFGFMPFRPGPGLGGHCIPIDPYYLSWRAKEFGITPKFIELAGEININMPSFVVSKVMSVVSKIKKPVCDIKVLVLGLSYKKNVDDARESPSSVILDLLSKHQFKISYSDPFITSYKIRSLPRILKSKKITPKLIKDHDLTILLTDHDAFNYSLIFEHSKLIIDTRNKFQRHSKVITA